VSVTDESVARESTTSDSRYWPVPVARGVVAIIVAVTITFSADHSPLLGYLAFGLFAVATAVIIGVLGTRRLDKGTERSFFLAQAIISAVAGIASLAASGAGVAFLLFIVSAFAAITGFLELYSGLRARRRFAFGKDWLFVGVLTALFAIAVLLVPGDFALHFTGPDDVARILTASVIVDGIIGAYAALLGVYLVIAGLSLKWGTGATEPVSETTVTQGGK